MAGQDGGYALGVDLGTSNTVAMLRWPDGRTRPLLFDGQPVMPSGVFLDQAGRLHVGRDAQRLAQADPGRYDPNPKRRIDEAGVLLGDAEVATVDLFAGLLRAVAQAAVEAVGFLPPAVLTYPATWGARRRDTLTTAVSRAGWPPAERVEPTGGPSVSQPGSGTRLVPEPVAAARYFADVLRRPVPVGAALAVFDFGGGTLDIAVVRNEGADHNGRARFVVIGSGGLAELGGLDLDAALVEHLGRLVSTAQPQVWQQLSQPESTTGWRNRRQFWDDVRGAKEMLSRTTVAPVAVPGVEQAVHLTRDELERLATPLLRRAVFEAGSVIAHCGLTPDQLAGLFLVGGSSRVPLVARLLHAELGVAPTVLEQPELPVAEGALAEIVAPPVRVAAMAAVPVSPGQLVSAGQGSWGGAAGEQASGGSSYPVRVARAGGLRNRRAVWIGAGAVLALAGVVTAAVLYLTRGGYDNIAFDNFHDVGKGISLGEEQPYYTYTALTGDRAYLAFVRANKRLEVIAATASTGTQAWRTTTAGSSDQWTGITALPNGLVILAGAISDSNPHELTVLDPANGKKLWGRSIHGDDSVYYFDRVLVLVNRTEDRLLGLDLRTGDQKWDLPNPKDQYGNAPTSVYPVTVPEDLGGAANATGMQATYGGRDRRIVQIGADRSARIIKVDSGEMVASEGGVADVGDLVVAHDGRLYIAPKDSRYQVTVAELTRMRKPAILYIADDQHYPVQLVPCGRERICLLDRANYDIEATELLSIDAKQSNDAKQSDDEVWRKPAAKAEGLLPVGEHIVVQTSTTPQTATVYGPDGTKLISKEGVAVRLDGGNLLLFADGLSTSVGNVSAAGVRVRSAEPIELGELKGVRPASCSWNSALIACPGDTSFVFRSFVKR
jgi:molecular chaperone HscA